MAPSTAISAIQVHMQKALDIRQETNKAMKSVKSFRTQGAKLAAFNEDLITAVRNHELQTE